MAASSAAASSMETQEYNKEFYKRQAYDVLGAVEHPEEALDYGNIGRILGYKKTNNTVRGVYQAVEDILKAGPRQMDGVGRMNLGQEQSPAHMARELNAEEYHQKASDMLEELWGVRINYAVIADYFGYTETNAAVKRIYDKIKQIANESGVDPEDWHDSDDDLRQSEAQQLLNDQKLLEACTRFLDTGLPIDYHNIKAHLGVANTNKTMMRMCKLMTQRRMNVLDGDEVPSSFAEFLQRYNSPLLARDKWFTAVVVEDAWIILRRDM